MKIGIECEGEFQGQKTLFLDASELKDISLIKKMPAVQQLYICDHKNELNLYDEDLARLAEDYRITVELLKFEDAPFYINVMLVVDSDSFWQLRGQDQVKFSKDLNVYAIQKKSMKYTSPVEFSSDVEYHWEKE